MTVSARLLAGLLLLVATTAGALALSVGPTAASCPQPSADSIDDNDVAFAGVVTNRYEAGDDVITTVKVLQVFKGDVTRRVDVVSASEAADNSMTAEPGERLVVFGRLVGDEVTSDACSTVVAPGQNYREVTAELGSGTEPAPGYLKAERRTLGVSYEQFSTGRAIFGAVVLIGMGYLLVGRWRARRRTKT